MRASIALWFGLAVLGVVGVVFTIVGATYLSSWVQARDSLVMTSAEVIDVHYAPAAPYGRGNRGAEPAEFLVVRFETETGAVVETTLQEPTANGEIGEIVTISHDRDEPSIAYGDASTGWIPPVIGLVLGPAIVAAVVWLVVVLARSRAPRAALDGPVD